MGLVVRKFLTEDKGSLSVLILSFFMTILITLIALTDISAIYFAKRSLTQASEAAAQRGVRNLDLDSYYKGKYNVSQLLANLYSARETDPGIPIDCQQGERDTRDALSELSGDRLTLFGPNLGVINIDEIACDGLQISLRTSAAARLPFVIPFTKVSAVRVSSNIGTFDERKKSTSYYGINIG